MKAGLLRDIIDLEQRVVTRNAIGDEVVTWSLVQQVYASIQPIRGREFLSLREMQSDITTRIVIRYLAGVETAMRFKVGDQAYQIDSIVDLENRHRTLECLCVAETVPT